LPIACFIPSSILIQQAHLAQAGLTDLVCQPVSVCILRNRTHISHFRYTWFLASHEYVLTCRFLAQAHVAEEISDLVQTHVLHDPPGSVVTRGMPSFRVYDCSTDLWLYVAPSIGTFQLKHTALPERRASTRVLPCAGHDPQPKCWCHPESPQFRPLESFWSLTLARTSSKHVTRPYLHSSFSCKPFSLWHMHIYEFWCRRASIFHLGQPLIVLARLAVQH
jgi:hypothetical protein